MCSFFPPSLLRFFAMADGPPQAKKAGFVARVTSEEKVKQFLDDIYADGEVLFCKFCNRSVD